MLSITYPQYLIHTSFLLYYEFNISKHEINSHCKLVLGVQYDSIALNHIYHIHISILLLIEYTFEGNVVVFNPASVAIFSRRWIWLIFDQCTQLLTRDKTGSVIDMFSDMFFNHFLCTIFSLIDLPAIHLYKQLHYLTLDICIHHAHTSYLVQRQSLVT